jgi:hypothetical protein
LFNVIHKAQEILIHYNENKKSFSLQKKQSKRSVKKQSMRFDNERPSNSRDTSANRNLDKKSNDQSGDFKVTSVSDNEIILKNKEKFLNVLKDITDQMNKRVSQIPSKRGAHIVNPSEELKENMHYYSNIDHIKMQQNDDKTFQNNSLKEKVKNEEKDIFQVHQKKEEPKIHLDQIKVKIDDEIKETQIKTQVIEGDKQGNKGRNKKGCACNCLIF